MRPSPMPARDRARVISPKMEPGTDFQVLPPPVAPSASGPGRRRWRTDDQCRGARA